MMPSAFSESRISSDLVREREREREGGGALSVQPGSRFITSHIHNPANNQDCAGVFIKMQNGI